MAVTYSIDWCKIRISQFYPRVNCPKSLDMALLYKFGFDNESGMKYSVSFYDKRYNITNAESLAQISSLQRRTWAQTIIAELNPVGLMLLSESNSYQMDDPFAERLRAENWGHAYVSLARTHTHCWLQIHRLYIFIYLSLFKVSWCLHVNSLR